MIPFTQFSQVSALLVLPLNPVPIVNLLGDGLKMEWEVNRTRSSYADQGTITVYNLSPSFRKVIHETWKVSSSTPVGYPLEFSIGWEGLAQRIITGDCWKVIPEIRNGEDVLTEFYVGDGNKQIRDAVPEIGQNFALSTISVIIKLLVTTILKVPIDPVSLALIEAKSALIPIPTWNNYVLNGDVQDRLDELIDMLDLEWKIYNGIFIVMEKGNAATAFPLAFVLNIASGLIQWAQTDDGSVEVIALANPNVRPGNQIIIQDSFGVPVGAPSHRVESIKFQGSTDGESIMTIMARKSIPL